MSALPTKAVRLPVAVLLGLALAAGPAGGQTPPQAKKDKDKDGVRPRAAAEAEAAGDSAEAEAEADALAFVRENHPELAALLAQLKPMKPEEYRRAVGELAQVSKNLSAVKAANPGRYALLLDAWKARSRVELLAARLASGWEPGPDMEGQLRQAIAAQVDAELRVQRSEKKAVEERLRRVTENLDRMESRRDSAVETRLQTLMKKSQRARRQAVKANTAKTNVNQAPDGAGNEAGGGSRKGERLP